MNEKLNNVFDWLFSHASCGLDSRFSKRKLMVFLLVQHIRQLFDLLSYVVAMDKASLLLYCLPRSPILILAKEEDEKRRTLLTLDI